MTLPVTSLFAALLAFVGLALAGNVGRVRSKAHISLGDGGQKALLVAMRQQANFVETVPLALVMLALIEFNGAPKAWLYALGALLTLARIAHPFGMDADKADRLPRIAGAGGTFLVLVCAALTLLWQYFAK